MNSTVYVVWTNSCIQEKTILTCLYSKYFFLFMPSGHIAMAQDLGNAAEINNRNT